MELPAGMEIEGKKNCVLKLRKSLYGLRSASYNWHQKLKAALEFRQFRESLSDPCVFIGKNMIVLVYVDDCIIISKGQANIDKFIESLAHRQENFIFTD